MSVVGAPRRRSYRRRMAEGWPTEHTEHTEGFLTGEDGVIGGRTAEGGGRTTADGRRQTADGG